MSTVQVKSELPFDELLNAVEQLSLPDLQRLMSRVIALQAQRKAPSLTQDETELILKINQGLPSKLQKHFDELVTKRQAETLTPAEHQELLRLTAQVEQLDAARAKCLAELAQLRGVTLTALMEALELRPPAYA
jgi:hypothetical protein